MKLHTLLAILQQSEYNLDRFQVWVTQHPQAPDIEPEQWTPKLRLIRQVVQGLFFLPFIWRFRLALLLTQPGEHALRRVTYARARQKIQMLRRQGLVVVAIAGSYGKTSTKHILQHALNPQLPSLTTPRSINTMLGISHIILRELTPQHKVFICELGEFNPGDLAELTRFLQPDWAILTPIGHQHLELLGSFDHVVDEFKKFVSVFEGTLDRVITATGNQTWLKLPLTTYGQPPAEWQIQNAQVSRAGTEFEVWSHALPQPVPVFIPLFGEHQATNTLPAFWLATKLGLSATQIAHNLSTLEYVERRHQPIFAEHNVLILDNSYNTNPDSIRESLKLLNQLNQGQRIIITAGFVEQGNEAETAHQQLGQLLAKTVDYVGIFNAKYVDHIKKGFIEAGGQPERVIVGRNQEELVQKMQPFITPGSVILFEGGYQEIHG